MMAEVGGAWHHRLCRHTVYGSAGSREGGNEGGREGGNEGVRGREGRKEGGMS